MEFQKDRNINKQWTSTQNKRVESSSRTSADFLCRFGHIWGTIYIGFFICFLRIIIAALSHEIFKRVLHRNALFGLGILAIMAMVLSPAPLQNVDMTVSYVPQMSSAPKSLNQEGDPCPRSLF